MSDTETMREISHTHPHTGDTFGSVYRRGPVAADGGKDVATDRSTADDVERTMTDVDHTTDDAAQNIWTRGTDHGQYGANR